jgi:hypothetical protein
MTVPQALSFLLAKPFAGAGRGLGRAPTVALLVLERDPVGPLGTPARGVRRRRRWLRCRKASRSCPRDTPLRRTSFEQPIQARRSPVATPVSPLGVLGGFERRTTTRASHRRSMSSTRRQNADPRCRRGARERTRSRASARWTIHSRRARGELEVVTHPRLRASTLHSST